MFQQHLGSWWRRCIRIRKLKEKRTPKEKRTTKVNISLVIMIIRHHTNTYTKWKTQTPSNIQPQSQTPKKVKVSPTVTVQPATTHVLPPPQLGWNHKATLQRTRSHRGFLLATHSSQSYVDGKTRAQLQYCFKVVETTVFAPTTRNPRFRLKMQWFTTARCEMARGKGFIWIYERGGKGKWMKWGKSGQ